MNNLGDIEELIKQGWSVDSRGDIEFYYYPIESVEMWAEIYKYYLYEEYFKCRFETIKSYDQAGAFAGIHSFNFPDSKSKIIIRSNIWIIWYIVNIMKNSKRRTKRLIRMLNYTTIHELIHYCTCQIDDEDRINRATWAMMK